LLGEGKRISRVIFAVHLAASSVARWPGALQAATRHPQL